MVVLMIGAMLMIMCMIVGCRRRLVRVAVGAVFELLPRDRLDQLALDVLAAGSIILVTAQVRLTDCDVVAVRHELNRASHSRQPIGVPRHRHVELRVACVARAQILLLRCHDRGRRDEALLGFSKTFKHLDGRDVTVSNKGVTKPFQVIRLNDGMPHHGVPSQLGTLHVKCTIKMPKKLTDKQIELIEKNL